MDAVAKEEAAPLRSPAPDDAATKVVDELRKLATALEPDQAPLQIAAALAVNQPHLALTDLEDVLEKLRSEGMESLFHDDQELRQFFRVMAERTLAKMFVLTENTLDLIQEKLKRTPIAGHSLGSLTKVLEALSKQSAATTQMMLTTNQRAEEARKRAAEMSTEELAAEVERRKAAVLQLENQP